MEHIDETTTDGMYMFVRHCFANINALACTYFQKMAGLARVHFIQASNQFELLNQKCSTRRKCLYCIFFSKKLFTKQVSNMASWLNRMASEHTGSRYNTDTNSGLHMFGDDTT